MTKGEFDIAVYCLGKHGEIPEHQKYYPELIKRKFAEKVPRAILTPPGDKQQYSGERHILTQLGKNHFNDLEKTLSKEQKASICNCESFKPIRKGKYDLP